MKSRKNSVSDSFSVEKKHVDPAWAAEDHGVKISNYAVAELFPEPPVYKTNTGVEIASWELPNLPDKYLDEISWPKNTPKYQVADLGLSLVKGRYYQTVNRADAQYVHNVIG